MGRIVKGPGHLAPRVTLEARVEAAALLATARAEAEALRADAERVREAARQEGLEAGRADGMAEAAVALAAARAEAARLFDAAAPTTIALASKMAERIVGRAVTLAPELMGDIVGEALSACRPGATTVRLRIHPGDLAAVEARRAAIEARAPAAALELVADEAVGRYGCVLETPIGRVDARLDTQLSALERALTAGSAGG